MLSAKRSRHSNAHKPLPSKHPSCTHPSPSPLECKLLQKYLQNADNLKRAHAMMRETFMDLLSDKVERDREQIQERTHKWELKMRQQELKKVRQCCIN